YPTVSAKGETAGTVTRATFLVSPAVDALRAIEGWDAGVAAAGVARADGVVATRGASDAGVPWASVTKLPTGAPRLVAPEGGAVGRPGRAGRPGRLDAPSPALSRVGAAA